MQTVVRRGRKVRRESIFPDLECLDVFLHEVEDLAPGCGVSKTDTRLIVRFLRAKFGRGVRPRHRAELVGARE